ncbi:MAG TPA: GldG family protein, partial [Thermodesulfobacteriota bacterium]|nr:GldG family protein [Thermodesulfobacteriota bacterium]
MSRASRIAAAAVATLAVIGILVVVELISIRYHYTWDLTANRRHSLSEASRRALAGLDRDVTILAFYVEARPGRQQAEDLLVQYRNASPRIRYELIDPQRQVGLARQHQVTTDETMVVLAGNGERRETVTFPDEEKLTNAILKVTRAGPRTVYVTTGHGERQLDETAERGLSRLKAALEDAGYKVAPLNLATAAAVPDDADVLVVAGPRADLLEPEAERLRRYLERGGHLLVLADVDVPQAPLPRLAGILKGYGIELRDAVLIEPNLRLALPDPLVAIVEQFATHPATSGLAKGGLAALLPIARPVLPADKAPEGVEQLTWLARSSATSWATPVSAFTPGARLGFDAKRDLKGPVTVAAAATFRPAKGAGAPAP